MKKVLIVFNHPAPYKVRLFNELSKSFDLHVIFEREKAKDRNKAFYIDDERQFKEHKIKGLPLGKENFLSNGIVKHLKNNKYDLIVMNGYSQFAELKAISYLKRNKIPYVLYINGGIIKEKESHLMKKIKTKYISGATAYFSPDSTSNKYLVYYGANEKRIINYPYSTIYKNEITTNTSNKSLIKASLNIPFEKVFVSAGQLIKRKNYISLINEWKKYPKDYGLYIIGDGKQKQKISELIKTNSLENVILTGFLQREKAFNYFKAADAFLFPSNEDIYGHVINESMSQGTPVISTKHVNSATKLIKNGINGFVLDSLTGEELKKSINYCLEHDLSDRCIETASNNTLEIMTREFVDMLNKVSKK